MAEEKTIVPSTYLCASCGIEVRRRWDAPDFGLCEPCEDKTRDDRGSWPGEPDGARAKREEAMEENGGRR